VLTATPTISPWCARNIFTNSMPTAIFFQNLTTPSTLVVIRKSVNGVIVTNARWSRCMSDFEYRGAVGSAARYSFSCGSVRRFFLVTAPPAGGSVGPMSSSEELSVGHMC
jgi:hypothetical protein